ncbi:uncharacterized protein MELLADRAFT_111588 [Melampsora larici-populina 98AG31]|uniref:Uncharacterized protein n=1 Tax=Melampsora larici-populina (strain 98AG31 / pathotype 3-4-7) TaxID=747676 RepID=F4S3P3_MELLP|nr:uncharacterized protein MELLADRAFT_111588 [Melampsora larici-populina 98AG31]EGG00707.1 hypothetical protein MELLADRAFT_111588 [Melampsora larici-populina 98AG31]
MPSSDPPGEQVEPNPHPTLLRWHSSQIGLIQASTLDPPEGTPNTLPNSQPTRIELRRRSASVLSNDKARPIHESILRPNDIDLCQDSDKENSKVQPNSSTSQPTFDDIYLYFGPLSMVMRM